ncbi:MAG TPA: translation initiation factor IF-1 [Candidatus Methylacidiphilales bacterium]|jgi:translation initiation factor IF-1|nr:translation initiation factor IF-1 [Candidatus Methylacidiphilales bacterium]
MPSGNVIHAKGTVMEVLKEGAYRIQLTNGHRCIARASGELRLQFVRLGLGDVVQLEFNPYDLSRARIVVAAPQPRA